MSSFTGRVFIYGLGLSANRLISLLALPILAAHLLPDAFGRIASLTVMVMILRMIFNVGIMTSVGIVYFEEESQRHRARVIGSAVGFVATMSVVMIAVAYALSDVLAVKYLGGRQYTSLVWLQVLSVSLLLIADPIMLRLQFENKAVKYALVSVGVPFLGMAVTLVLVAGYEMGVTGWVFGQVFTGLVQLGVTSCVAMSGGGIARGSLTLVRRLVTLGTPLLPSALFLYVLQYSGHYFLPEYADLHALGIYNVGYGLGLGVALIVGAFSNAWYPFFQSHMDRQDEARKNFSHIASIYVAVFAVLVFVIYIVAWPAMMILTAPGLYEGYRVIGPIALAQAMLGFSPVLMPGLYFAKKVYIVPILQGVASLVAIGGAIALIQNFGPEGAAYAIVGGALSLILLQIALNAWKNYDVCAYDWRRIAAMGLILVMQISFYRWLDDQTSMLMSGVVGVILALGGAYTIWRILDGSERELIIRTLRRRE